MAVVAPIVSTFDKRGIQQAEKGFGNFSRNVGRQLRNVAIAATTIGVAVGAAVTKAIGSASDLDEAISATNQIFGDASDAVLAFADSAAEAFGQSKQEALDGALVFGTFGKAAGLAGDDLSNFTNGLLGLSSDIASFRNATPQEAIEAIGAALRGESEPLRRFGVLLDDATLKAEALELGIYDGSGALTQQQKILAAEAAIYRQTADAQGDFARTSDGLANSSRILRARLANVSAQIGGAFLPIALKLSGFLLDKVVPAVEKLADTFSEEGLLGVMKLAWSWLKDNGPKIGEWALSLAGSLIGWIATNANPAIRRLGEWLDRVGDWILTVGYPYLKEQFGEWVQLTWDWLTEDVIPKLSEWLDNVTEWLDNTGRPAIRDGFGSLREFLFGWITGTEVDKDTQSAATGFVKSLVGFVTSAVKTSFTLNVELAKTFATAIGSTFLRALDEVGVLTAEEIAKIPAIIRATPGVLRAFFSFGLDLGQQLLDGLLNFITNTIPSALLQALRAIVPDWAEGFLGIAPSPASSSSTGGRGGGGIVRLAEGGIVTRPTFAMIGEGGEAEAVIPLSKLGRMGGDVNITIQGAVDPVGTARQIRQILEQDQRRLGRLSPV